MPVREIVDAAAGASPDKTYIEDVFSTYLYTGTGGSNQTINNGIDLAGKGGLVWGKNRTGNGEHLLFDTSRGVNKALYTSSTAAETNDAGVSSFNSNGFTTPANSLLNTSGVPYASWTFRKAPKFFDVVTYTGNGVSGRTINHSLGVEPSMILIKNLTNIGNPQNWCIYIRAYANQTGLVWTMPGTSAAQSSDDFLNTPTASNFTVNNYQTNNWSGTPYVAYLFAHDTSVDGLIQCGTYVGNGSTTGPTINLGWEPQFLITKQAYVGASNWSMFDNMRGMSVGSADSVLYANTISAESSTSDFVTPTATGFQVVSTSSDVNTSGRTYFYMAIRRGPMKTPTDGTKVFEPQVYTANDALNRTFTNSGSFVTDAVLTKNRNAYDGVWMINRLVGNEVLRPWFTDAGNSAYSGLSFAVQNGYSNSAAAANYYYWNDSTRSNVQYYFRRAPGFFDVVCYTGNGVARTVNHNLGIAPELMIVKGRNNAFNWYVYHSGVSSAETKYLVLNDLAAAATGGVWNNTSPTSTNFSLGTAAGTNQSTYNYVAYLFASCPGVSKVGSYTGNGSSQTINCGFTGGARFILIKRTDSTGDWYVWDTARGAVSGTDPRLALNTTAAEVNANWVYTTTGGFQIVTSDASVNASSGSYIYLAIA